MCIRDRSDPESTLKDMFEFLQVDATFTPTMRERHNVSTQPKSQGLNQLILKPNPLKALAKKLPTGLRTTLSNQLKRFNTDQRPQLSAELKAQLTAQHQDDILLLQELIQRDLSSWLWWLIHIESHTIILPAENEVHRWVVLAQTVFRLF